MSRIIAAADAARIPLADDSVDAVVTSVPYWRQRDYGYDGQLGHEETVEDYIAALVEVFAEVRRVLVPWGSLWLNIGDKRFSRSAPGRGVKYQGKPGIERSLKARPYDRFKDRDLGGIPAMVADALRADGWWWRADVVWEKPQVQPETIRGWAWEPCRSLADPLEPCTGCKRCDGNDGLALRLGAWRPTTSHEMIYLLTPDFEYFADQLPILEPTTGNAHSRGNGRNPAAAGGAAAGSRQNDSWSEAVHRVVSSRNPRSILRVPSVPFRAERYGVEVFEREPDPDCVVHAWDGRPPVPAGGCTCRLEPAALRHYASFPPALPEYAISASTSERGCCPTCSRPWARVVDRRRLVDGEVEVSGTWNVARDADGGVAGKGSSSWNRGDGSRSAPQGIGHYRFSVEHAHLGWRPTCRCHEALETWEGAGRFGDEWIAANPHAAPRRSRVLDPFSGTGAVGEAAAIRGRDYVGLDLSVPYCRLGAARSREPGAPRPFFFKPRTSDDRQKSLFDDG